MTNRLLLNRSRSGFEIGSDVVNGIRNAHSVDIAVSYLQMSGWYILQNDLARIPPDRVRIVTTDQMNITQPAVLRKALRMGVDIRCYCGSRVFHPKVYIFRGIDESESIAILGSANISAS